MLRTKRIFVLFVCAFLISGIFGELSHGSASLTKPLLTFSANYDSSVSGMVHNDDTPMIENARRYSKISGVVSARSRNRQIIEGRIISGTGSQAFTADGEIEVVPLSNRSEGYIGNFTGLISDSREHINLTVHASPRSGDILVFVTVGVVSSETSVDTFVFGKPFDDMNVLATAYRDRHRRYAEELGKSSTLALATNSSPYNETLRGTGYGAGRLWTGELVNMAAVTFYAPLRVVPRSKYKTWVKINSSESNAQYFIRTHYNFVGMLSTWVSGATCEIGSNHQFMEVSEPDPSSSIAWTVQLPVPWFVNGSFSWSPWNISIPLFSIRATLERLAGSQYNDIVKWTHNYGRNVDWSNNGPAATAVGYAGMNSIHFLHNPASELAVNMHARGTVSYSFQHQIGATLYAGGFTVATPTVVATITVDR
ncbi:MAG: hypothetical protein KGZ92_00825 [Firmicutes bacterium]|nr:hypothetical protein [Dethiobacter sp.]MBS3887829.1 hypothetical protein [Bacillota bacterium]MBS4055493.1 hypothetical protein [Thermaerobacter sp.]